MVKISRQDFHVRTLDTLLDTLLHRYEGGYLLASDYTFSVPPVGPALMVNAGLNSREKVVVADIW